MTFREFLQLTEMFYSKGKGPKPKHDPHTDAPGALAKNDLNLHLYAGGSAGAVPGKKMQKKMQKEGVGSVFAGGGQAGADPGFGQGPGGPMGTGVPFCDKKKKKHDPDKTFGMEGPVLPKLSRTKGDNPSE